MNTPIRLPGPTLLAALEFDDVDLLRAVVASGEPLHARTHECGTVRNMERRLYSGLSAVGLAVLCEGDAIENFEEFAFGDPDEDESEALTRDGREVEFLPVFEGLANGGGVHADGGYTLMHLALAPQVARWLIEHGAPCDIRDDKGQLPEDVLPARTAAVIRRHKALTPAAGDPSTLH